MNPLEGPKKQIAGFDTMLQEELEQLRIRRQYLLKKDVTITAATGIEQAHEFGALGLGLSGGGIRSATFNLGILQGLASLGLLPHVDYLSTASGGGFIGSWLHGVIKRLYKGDPAKAAENLDPEKHTACFGDTGRDPIAFLRMYSNYLAPRPGLLSADSWVIFTIWLRNMFLNQLILIPALCAGILAIVMAGVALCAHKSIPHPMWLGILPLVFFVIVAGANIRAIAEREFPIKPLHYPRWLLAAFPAVLAVLASACAAFCAHWKLDDCWSNLTLLFIYFSVLFFILQWLGGFLECFAKKHPNSARLGIFLLILFPLVAASATVALLFGSFWLLNGKYGSLASAVWGPPLLILATSTGVVFHIGLMGSDFADASREWLARVGAILSIVCFAWMVLAGISLYGPFWVSWLALNYGATAVTALVAWVGATLAGVKLAGSPATTGPAEKQAGSPVKEFITQVAPVIFVLGLLILLSTAVHFGLSAIQNRPAIPVVSPAQPLVETSATLEMEGGKSIFIVSVGAVNAKATKTAQYAGWFAPLAPFLYHYGNTLYNIDLSWPNYYYWVFLILLAAPAVLLPLRFNINEFSLLHFYKNRLVRCYLGAGNTVLRKPNRFTGFDPKDDFPIASLLPTANRPYYGPYAIVNTALNTNVGAEMGRQERKASSFVFTPLRSGFSAPRTRLDRKEVKASAKLDADAYRLTRGYLYPNGPDLGTVAGISGAAANPNSGYHTSAAVAFLLTWFNVRLGWWVGNPRIIGGLVQSPPDRPGPLYSIRWLFQELLAQTTSRSKYLNLSDGGHFDNLGLYELVRRRCRYIVIGDGETDPDLTFESLGGAIRKCRADFDVEIDIDIDRIQASKGFSQTHCVVGQIIYPEISKEDFFFTAKSRAEKGKVRGWLLYLKASVTGDEPEDIKQYKASDPVFPHNPITRQFFTESLFESYRRLGYHIASKAFENVSPTLPDLDPIFQELAALWYPPSSLTPGVATKHADAYSALMNKLGSSPDLQFLDAEVNGGNNFQQSLTDDQKWKAKFFLLELIQLMENVWFDFQLQSPANRDNPNNSGWLSVFKRWTNGTQFNAVWATECVNYNPLFQKFVKEVR